MKVLGKSYAFLRWKGKVYRQLFYVTNANNSPNLLSRGAYYTLGVIKPCYSMEAESSSSLFQEILQVTPTQPFKHLEKLNMQGEHDSHYDNKGTATETPISSSKDSIMKDELQGTPLTKARILDMYSDIFTGIGKFLGKLYKFQLKKNAKPMRHAPRKVPIHLQDDFHKEIRNLEQLGILERVTEVTEWVNSFVILEKYSKVINSHSPGHSVTRKLQICLDPRD